MGDDTRVGIRKRYGRREEEKAGKKVTGRGIQQTDWKANKVIEQRQREACQCERG